MMPDGTLQIGPAAAFKPDMETQRRFRDCLGRFATGVTIVTAATPEGGIGMTANSFTSVSMDPPLVLWCPARASGRFPAFARARHFAIHVLSADQQEVALAFARSGTAFDGLALDVNAQGVPLLTDCLARLECETHALQEAGDHAIMLGRVRRAQLRDGEPLVFSQGKFRRFDKLA
jgi:flavin reductase (DIM6/NTAB) family NADH-FMN oxidoreductase RutF